MNRLIKNSNKIYTPGSPGIPASAGQPYLPARVVTQYQTVCSYGPDETTLLSLGWSRQWVSDGQGQYGGSYQWFPPAGWTGGVQIPYVYACRQVPVQVTLPAQPYIAPTPAVPATPAQFYADNNLGWNSGAESIAVLHGDGRVAFQAGPSSAGVVIGLNAEGSGVGYLSIQHAFKFIHGIASVIERGAEKAMLGGFTADDVFTIRREAGAVSYEVNGTEVYASLTPSDGPVVLDVSMYSGGDTVFNPVIEGFSVANLSFLPLVGTGTNMMSFEPLEAAKNTAFMSFEALRGSEQLMSFEPMTLEAESVMEDVPWYAIGDLSFAGMTMSASGTKLPSGQANMSFEPIAGSEQLMSFEPMRVFGGTASVEVLIASVCRCAYMQTAAGTLVRMMGSHNPGFFAEESSTIRVRMLAGHNPGFTVQASWTALARMIATHAPGFFAVVVDLNHEAWVMNARSGGFTRYENYPFNSFAKVGGINLGAAPDGIYELDGGGDEPVRAMVSFGKQDFGTSLLKSIPNAYIGVSSCGRLWMRVVVGGRDYLYRARTAGEDLATQRFDLGRGLRANYIEFELYNEDGDDFELSSVEFVVLPTTRRIRA